MPRCLSAPPLASHYSPSALTASPSPSSLEPQLFLFLLSVILTELSHRPTHTADVPSPVPASWSEYRDVPAPLPSPSPDIGRSLPRPWPRRGQYCRSAFFSPPSVILLPFPTSPPVPPDNVKIVSLFPGELPNSTVSPALERPRLCRSTADPPLLASPLYSLQHTLKKELLRPSCCVQQFL